MYLGDIMPFNFFLANFCPIFNVFNIAVSYIVCVFLIPTSALKRPGSGSNRIWQLLETIRKKGIMIQND